MLYIQRYRSPLGEILMAADDAGLVGLWFAGQKHFAPGLTQAQEQETPVLAAAAAGWTCILRTAAPFYPAAAPDWHGIPHGGVVLAAGDSLRRGHHLR